MSSSNPIMNNILRCVSGSISAATEFVSVYLCSCALFSLKAVRPLSVRLGCALGPMLKWSQGQPKQCAMYLQPLSSVYSQKKGDGQVDVYAV